MTTPTSSLVQELVRTACLAPSVHNSQPWSWRLPSPDVVELYADRSRQLVHGDPQGRDLLVSCGAALHHLTVAAPAFGLAPQVELVVGRPDVPGDLLARTRLVPCEATETDVARLASLENRVTDRRAFTDWEVPVDRLARLAAEARPWGAHVRVIHEPGQVHRAEALLERARRGLLADPVLVAEQDAWVGRGDHDGIPAGNALPHQRDADEGRPSRFDTWTTPPHRTGEARPEADHAPILGLFTASDDELAWLHAGMALSAVWLSATQQGLALAPQTHVVEQPRLRHELRHDLFDDLGWPQVVLRVGWPQSRHHLVPHTPRRPLTEVLRP